eukprot:1157737-Pelagomonas_calceolata.AAC.4
MDAVYRFAVLILRQNSHRKSWLSAAKCSEAKGRNLQVASISAPVYSWIYSLICAFPPRRVNLVLMPGSHTHTHTHTHRIISDASASSKVSCTPAFQPPEALIWGFTEDPIISDVWALGVCLFCFIFGRLPFTGSCVLDITNSITNDMVRVWAHVSVKVCTCCIASI